LRPKVCYGNGGPTEDLITAVKHPGGPVEHKTATATGWGEKSYFHAGVQGDAKPRNMYALGGGGPLGRWGERENVISINWWQ